MGIGELVSMVNSVKNPDQTWAYLTRSVWLMYASHSYLSFSASVLTSYQDRNSLLGNHCNNSSYPFFLGFSSIWESGRVSEVRASVMIGASAGFDLL